MTAFAPEGPPVTPPSQEELRKGADTGRIFQAMCVKCDEFHNLHLDLGPVRAIIPREETALGIAEGTAKEIAIVSRVGKPVCFQVLAFDRRGTAILSRRAAQARAKAHFLDALRPGDILPALVQNAADFGVFCDIGCGFSALMRIDRCCISRLQSCGDHFHPGQRIYGAVLAVDREAGQIQLTGRELLGTWEENAAGFRQGQTVTGTVRTVMPYGVFVELTPNLSGLAESALPVRVGDPVSVFLRAILPEKHKIKLNILEILAPGTVQPSLPYYRTEGRLDRWEYYPGSRAVTVF